MKRILWFRRDLRIRDNPLLSLGGEVLPIFIFDRNILNKLSEDDRRVSLIFSRVLRLKKALKEKGLELKIFYGAPIEIFSLLAKRGFDEVAASGDYEPYASQRDRDVSHILPFNYLHDTYIFQPDEILKSDRSPYLVFTPFYKKARSLLGKRHLKFYLFVQHTLYQTDYSGITRVEEGREKKGKLSLSSLGFRGSEAEMTDVYEKLTALKERINNYEKNRDFPSKLSTSQLSVELRFGTISIRELLRFLAREKKEGKETESFFRQLVFRDFYAYLLYHFPHLQSRNYRYAFKGIEDHDRFEAFCLARTGVPIIDAGVRELLETGNMHNRVRMICASFFTKDLLLPWQWGEAFFAEHLLDYDAASNILSWQWSAGTGIDPQPYFRIFNPYLQSKKFDKEALYIKRWLPELDQIDPKILHNEEALFECTIPGYVQPMLKHKAAAKRALDYFKTCPRDTL